ncbi:hypothetical protein ACFQY5_05315 [Paeniroseomonas aquatica]|uniref:hypothetical protein n=1 Tax=Paeniroseomonas aquatica TaxID=373043 RepID=UPI00361C3C9A
MTPQAPARNPLREVRSLGQATALADDAAVTRIVGFLDGLVDRGELDRIIDPVRPRLRGLGTPRRLRFARLLFLPLDGGIVSAQDWSRGAPLLPRSALRVLADAVQRAMGPEGAAIAATAAQCTTEEAAQVAACGARVWPAAARLLPEAPPPGWAECGLSAGDYAGIAALCRPLWAAGTALWAALAAAAEGPPEALARAALQAVTPAGPEALALALATLLQRATAPGRLLQAASALHPQARGVAQQALDGMLAGALPPFVELRPHQLAATAQALAAQLDDLAECPLLTGDRPKRLAAARQRAELAFRSHYMALVEQHMLAPAARLGAAPQVQDAEVAAMETAARHLRALEAAGRRLGGGLHYDWATQEMTRRIAALLPPRDRPGALRRIDLARCLEILAGPEVAAAALGRG